MQRKLHLELTWNDFLRISSLMYTVSSMKIANSLMKQNLGELTKAILSQIPDVNHLTPYCPRETYRFYSV